ncbi:MAG: type VI secretion system ImpA family N-terminal domain-containing protein [Holosporales bacterium]|jgi:type VI secretion system protein ImpA|nr:type VI secretion system ImpA family N-terminal domain-containing protein [Holosporales bacterium]
MSTDSYSIDDIIAEINGTPGGVGSDISLTSDYDDIKNARIEEDDQLSLGVWERELKKADWRKVEKLTIEMLENKSKDLQLIAWLSESSVIIYGFNGILKVMDLLRSFIESFWGSCYPKNEKNESDEEQKFRILDWIYETIAVRMLFIPFIPNSEDEDKNINLYQYEYALELKQRMGRAPSHSEEITGSAKKNNIKTLEEIQRIIEQADPKLSKSTLDVLEEISVAIDGLAQTIAKISQKYASGVFYKLKQNLTKISSLLKQHQKAESPQETRETQEGIPYSTTEIFERDKLYKQIEDIQKRLEKIEKHSPSHGLLSLIVSWQNKSLLEIVKDLKTGETEGHKLIKFMLG